MSLTVPSCGSRIGGTLQLRTTVLDPGCGLGVQERVSGHEVTARICLRHVGVAVASGSSSQVAHGDLGLGLSLAVDVRGGNLSVGDVTRGLHDCEGLGVKGWP